ncbi:hypothetical protein TNIN_85121 [Trichonephila inaurata madagascariensis]|uniref:Uncharacterized protein n=1 Tax=Trichonephila inaurata madagascariensis TaxID=2747483 RepID=A0A8X7CBK3_9ARAC|nr:hypothetical protein TNIN_85121 [Trichonephila inaurata madagascariensis]
MPRGTLGSRKSCNHHHHSDDNLALILNPMLSSAVIKATESGSQKEEVAIAFWRDNVSTTMGKTSSVKSESVGLGQSLITPHLRPCYDKSLGQPFLM